MVIKSAYKITSNLYRFDVFKFSTVLKFHAKYVRYKFNIGKSFLSQSPIRNKLEILHRNFKLS